MRRLSEINRHDKRRRGAACTRRRRVDRDQHLGLRGGLPGHWEAFLQLVSTSVIVDQDYFLLRLIWSAGRPRIGRVGEKFSWATSAFSRANSSLSWCSSSRWA